MVAKLERKEMGVSKQASLAARVTKGTFTEYIGFKRFRRGVMHSVTMHNTPRTHLSLQSAPAADSQPPLPALDYTFTNSRYAIPCVYFMS